MPVIDDLFEGKDAIVQAFEGNAMVSIAGGSCSGKTEIIKSLPAKYAIAVLSLDSYYLNGNKDTNFDHPDSLELGLAYGHLQDLVNGKDIDMPLYDFTTHTRELYTTEVEAGEKTVVEGLFALFEDFRNIPSYKVFMDVERHVALERRIKRDVEERGRTREGVIKQFNETVWPMYEKHVLPQRNYADLVIRNNKVLDL